jgi:hypothetical protein
MSNNRRAAAGEPRALFGSIAAAAAIAATGVVAGPAPESAAACSYEYPGSFVLNQSNGFRVEILGGVAGPTFTGRASSFNSRQQRTAEGTAWGNTWNNNVHISIDWDNGSHGSYFGVIRPDRTVSGSTEGAGSSAAWESVTALNCVEGSANN